ncbi:MAG: hypothetical protein JO103_01625 [Candidatus Eremiobacteraeota bacterium]|nr:hypothetical protein [Candidatus Eremiobacteraeota bacterium]MBV9409062.1 hypothetical protein [Candidatus Eremiobacteraeota bacterium]
MSDARAALGAALAAEREQRWAESFVNCRRALADAALHPDAFNLFGRLCHTAGDAANAIAAQRYVLVLAPEHPHAAGDLQTALGAVRAADDARAVFAAAVAIAPEIDCHHREPLALRPFARIDEVEALLLRAVDDDPSSAPARAALGNVRARRGRAAEALDAYRIAAMLDWERADVHLALAMLFDLAHDEANGARHRHEALARQRLYPACAGEAARSVLVLAAPGGPTANAPLDYCVDPARVALHVYYLARDEPPPALPAHDLVFNAIEQAESSADAIARAARFAAAQRKPVLNDPARLAGLRRSALPTTLRDVAGISVPPARRVERALLDAAAAADALDLGVPGPVLVRPVDTHRGDHQARVARPDELRAYLARTPGDAFDVTSFVDYRSADGYYRKYRVIIVGGVPFPYHVAISDAWKVHYHSSRMDEHDWMRAEEERFMRDPRAVFPAWETAFGALAAAVGLDYVGVDCAVNADGWVLVFECGPGMLVHGHDDPSRFPYKHELVPRLFAALEALFDHTASRAPGLAPAARQAAT